MEIDTGNSSPKKQALRRMPYAARQEIARQIEEMQRNGVIQPSQSPWSSPVVLVKKKDGSQRFCVNYRELNSVTKVDMFPLPRIDDLLDQLGESRYFSTLDLASGFWQIPVHPNSREKTAFVTPNGLFEFRVMPFGLCNSPAVFQRLMQQVLMGLNPPEAPGFVSVYIDDVLFFSKTLQEHLKLVIQCLQEVGLKLKPEKCKYACKQVEYLGHVISSSGLKPNHKLTAAVCDFPTPRNVKEVRRFLGLTSYYRKFIPDFARVAEPLHRLTRKDVEFSWTTDCQISFDTLKKKLTEATLLAYPSFDRDFVLETDASIHGLGAILSQVQDDHKSHPIAYVSRALSTAEKNYGITELETLAVVWAMSHYHCYLYGHCVTVYTDHSAVKALLETPNPTGKHARWWTKVFAQGVRRVHIVYKAGKENVNADALSRSPHAPAPLVGDVEEEVQVAVIDVSQVPATGDTCRTDISSLLLANPVGEDTLSKLSVEQKKDLSLQ